MTKKRNVLSSTTKQMLNQARKMNNWELIRASIYNHSLILQELKKEKPSRSEITQRKRQIAIIKQALNEKSYETEDEARAFTEIHKEITEQFHSLFKKYKLNEERHNSSTDVALS